MANNVARLTPAALRAEANRLEEVKRERKAERHEHRFIQFSKLIAAGLMAMYFVGVAVGSYKTLRHGEPVTVLLDYIMKLALPGGYLYFSKAFGENVLKIVLGYVYDNRGTYSDGGH